ncbi:MAG: DUF2752 domain-containing protein [Saprospiraceae bacterium]|nr:DUF2752 domain-containing protein [Saprospiraceae bacterium]
MSRKSLYTFMIGGWIAGIIFLFLHMNNFGIHLSEGQTFCISNNVLGIPCPSCGATRSVIAILNGQFIQGLLYNPIGYLLVLLLSSPLWIIYDIMTTSSGFYNFYRKTEFMLRQKLVLFPALILIIANWIWNLYKYL